MTSAFVLFGLASYYRCGRSLPTGASADGTPGAVEWRRARRSHHDAVAPVSSGPRRACSRGRARRPSTAMLRRRGMTRNRRRLRMPPRVCDARRVGMMGCPCHIGADVRAAFPFCLGSALAGFMPLLSAFVVCLGHPPRAQQQGGLRSNLPGLGATQVLHVTHLFNHTSESCDIARAERRRLNAQPAGSACAAPLCVQSLVLL